ncbi:endolytic transglycosylase MltG [Rubellimicrobium roseum]|uniref:Endolytic murein transglycosylase n=1 Tax=Rubellimicrobium roseum TaxID=687525 RepID=A0A5C4NHR8_9RHOB|nr:endolytic transglycosylase MltG [Rubellimicrobium roseum]TNC73415.1 endolytic transglycosylase MltG [Rubellimicrobium roseum]
MWRHVAANALTFLTVGLFLLAGLVTWGVQQYSAPGPLAEAICLRVPAGATMRRISDDLAERGAIASPTVFRLGADYTERSGQEKQGSFLIPASASMDEITAIVTEGGPSTCGTEVVYRIGVARTLAEVRERDLAGDGFTELAEFQPGLDPIPAAYEQVKAESDTTYRVVMAEGVTSWQVVQALNALDVLEGDVEEVPAEGMLAPDSYAITPGTPVADVIARMQSAQETFLAQAWENRAEGLPFDTPEEALTLASIVEKETAIPEERPIVASVLVNRIEQGMRLQFDPTIIYGITRGQGLLDRPIRESDIAGATEAELHGEVLYNTYVVNGLPAGPIANPGRPAIEAALNPAATDYLYFVADGSGGHAFAETLDEHNENVIRWRQIEAEAGQDG